MRLPRPLAWWIDLTFFVPIRLLALLREQWPVYTKSLAQTRQATINRAQLARLAAQVVVERAQSAATPPAPGAAEPAPLSRLPVPDAEVAATQPDASAVAGAGDLPIPDYESLAAIHVVHRLGTLRTEELEQVRSFEQANRGRRTILAKIEQLQDADT